MELHFAPSDSTIKGVEERLISLSLAFTKVEEEGLDIPYIQAGKSRYRGLESMNAYLDKLDSEKDQWYYCNC